MDIGPTMAKWHGGQGSIFFKIQSKSILSNETMFFRKNKGEKILTQILVFGSFFGPPAFHTTRGGGGGGSKKFSTGPRLSEYVWVVCRNTKGTCLKSVSKTPTFRFFRDFQPLKTVAHIQPNGQFWTVFGQNGQNGIFCQKSVWNIFFAVKSPN